MNISVCMASYNGSNFIAEQIQTILTQLLDDDELIIVDDCSEDNTVNIINSFSDKRIRLVQNSENIGPALSFSKCLLLSKYEIIFLTDQDDIWLPHKRAVVLRHFLHSDADLIVHNAYVSFDDVMTEKKLFDFTIASPGLIKNFRSNTYTGCCIAIRKNLLMQCLPINVPRSISMYHDAWIGFLSQAYGYKTKFIPDPLIIFRRHGANFSTFRSRGLYWALKDRLTLICYLFTFICRRFFR